MTEKILHLPIKKEWFDLIKSGKKKVEYREIKLYWTKRLFTDILTTKKFDYIIFTNGYRKDSPKLKVEWKGMGYKKFEGKKCYAIKLGKIIE